MRDYSRRAGAELDRPYYLGLLADVLLVEGDARTAFANIAEAIAQVRTTRTFFYEVELWRLRGIALLRLNESSAEESLIEALELARAQGARALELRAAVSLAEVANGKVHTRGARELVAQAYGWFTEGFDSPDLVRARELLQLLGADAA